MTRTERAFVILLRAGAVVLLLAIPPIVMPFSWMDAIHRWLGMGALPDAPITGYLTRSISALYAMHGALILYVSFDVRRYRSLIRVLAVLAAAFGAVMLPLDLVVGMPWFWTLGEGPFIIAAGAVLYCLATRLPLQP